MPKENKSPLSGYKILVVDDEPDALMYIRTVLEDNGASTFIAHDGNEAIAVARAELPHLVTLDLGMPEKNGVDTFFEMRKDPALCEIPICIITGRPEMRRLIYEHEAGRAPEGYIDKPVNEEVLMRNVRKIFGIGRDGKKRTGSHRVAG